NHNQINRKNNSNFNLRLKDQQRKMMKTIFNQQQQQQQMNNNDDNDDKIFNQHNEQQYRRRLETEIDEMKELIFSMKHSINILEKIRRTSKEYIHYMRRLFYTYCYVKNNNNINKLQKIINEIDNDLDNWEQKYESILLFQQQSGNDDKIRSLFSLVDKQSTAIHSVIESFYKKINKKLTLLDLQRRQQQSQSDNVNTNNGMLFSSNKLPLNKDLARLNQSKRETSIQQQQQMIMSTDIPQSDNAVNNKQSTSSLNNSTISNTNNNNGIGSNLTAGGGVHRGNKNLRNLSENTSTNVTQQQQQSKYCSPSSSASSSSSSTSSSSTSLHNQCIDSSSITPAVNRNSIHSGRNNNHHQINNNIDQQKLNLSQQQQQQNLLQQQQANKPLLYCDYNGCKFQTNIRQRLVMHKRVHLGEVLYHCDVEGCGYFSNYKGNIKIHKKHRHRLPTTTDDNNGSTTTTATSTISPSNTNRATTRSISAANEAQQNHQIVNSKDIKLQQQSSSSYMDDHLIYNNNNGDNQSDIIMDNDSMIGTSTTTTTKRRGRKRKQRIYSEDSGHQHSQQQNFIHGQYSNLNNDDDNDNNNGGGGNVDDDSIINEFNLGFMADDVSSFGNDQFGGGIPLDGNNININSGGDNLIESTFIKNQSTNEYECNLDGCNYKTRWRHCIIGHQYLHAGIIKPFCCDFPGCQFRSNLRTNIDVHKQSRHKDFYLKQQQQQRSKRQQPQISTTKLYRCRYRGCSFTTPWPQTRFNHEL
ncbi:hypothetical protein DERP_008296, partial [Dermatophagoides pteronyssinus]